MKAPRLSLAAPCHCSIKNRCLVFLCQPAHFHSSHPILLARSTRVQPEGLGSMQPLCSFQRTPHYVRSLRPSCPCLENPYLLPATHLQKLYRWMLLLAGRIDPHSTLTTVEFTEFAQRESLSREPREAENHGNLCP